MPPMPPNPHLDNLPDTADPVMDIFDINTLWELTTDEIEPHPIGEKQPLFYIRRRMIRNRVYILVLKARWGISVIRQAIGLAKRMVFHTGAGLGDPDRILDGWEPWTYVMEMDLDEFGYVSPECPDEINLRYYVSGCFLNVRK
jgi:hypothetical protein